MTALVQAAKRDTLRFYKVSVLLGVLCLSGVEVVFGQAVSTQQRAKIRPSFDCAKAVSLDEVTICADARLAELDKLYHKQFLIARRARRADAIQSARHLLRQRALCGNDRVCILDVVSSAGFGPPSWLEEYRKRLIDDVLKDDLRIASYNLVGLTSSLPIAPKGPLAMIRLIEGVDTDQARVVGQITRSDYIEFCERDPGGIRAGTKETANQCAEKLQAREGSPTFSATAVCSSKIVVSVDGRSWQLIIDGGDIRWKDGAGELFDTSSYTDVAESLFQLLCANSYARVRATVSK